MINKKIFYDSINKDAVFDESFFKKVYGYSAYDNNFLKLVAQKLSAIGKKEVIDSYNVWYESWKREYDLEIKKACGNERKQIVRETESKKLETKKEVSMDWRVRKEEVLLKKKKLLLTKKSKQLTNN